MNKNWGGSVKTVMVPCLGKSYYSITNKMIVLFVSSHEETWQKDVEHCAACEQNETMFFTMTGLQTHIQDIFR